MYVMIVVQHSTSLVLARWWLIILILYALWPNALLFTQLTHWVSGKKKKLGNKIFHEPVDFKEMLRKEIIGCTFTSKLKIWWRIIWTSSLTPFSDTNHVYLSFKTVVDGVNSDCKQNISWTNGQSLVERSESKTLPKLL